MLLLVMGLALIVLQGWTVIAADQPFDPLAFGGGAAALLGGGGLGIGAKRKDEPDL